MLIGGQQGNLVAECTETEQAAARDVTEITLFAKLFSGKSIAQVTFNKWDLNGQKGITQRDAGVRETAWIHNDKFDPVDGGLLNAVNEFMFGITLKAWAHPKPRREWDPPRHRYRRKGPIW